MKFIFETENMNEAITILDAIRGINTSADTPTTPSEDKISEDREDGSMIQVSYVDRILNKLADSSEDYLEISFGERKPYKVLRKYDLDLNAIGAILGILPEPRNSSAVLPISEVKETLDIIVKDKSVGGLTHDEMEGIFGVRSSAGIFSGYSIVEMRGRLKDNGYIE